MKIIFGLIFLFIPLNSYAGSFFDAIHDACPSQSEVYKDAIQEYAIRMRDYVDIYGCGVVSAYGVFASNDMDRVTLWEDDEQSFDTVSQVFLFADQYHLDIAAKPILFDILNTLIQRYDLAYVDTVLSQTTQRERQRMSQNPERILYLLWAMQLSHDQKPKGILSIAHRLRRDYPSDLLISALFLDANIIMIYPEYAANKRLKMIRYTIRSYSKDFMKKVVLDSLALSNITSLLPPQAVDMEGSQGLTDKEIRRLQRQYAIAMQALVQSFESAGTGFGAAMDAAAVLAPWIQQALVCSPHLNASIVAYLRHQIHSPVFQSYIQSQENCQKESFSGHVAMFFRFLSPNQKMQDGSIKPVAYLQNNLASIAMWYQDEPSFESWLMDAANQPDLFVYNMSWLPYFYERSAVKSKKYMSKLLYNLPDTANKNASFILRLHERTGYFDWLEQASDWNDMVIESDSIGDYNAPKYRYILTTPFPSKEDDSVFTRYNSEYSSIALLAHTTVRRKKSG